MLERLTGKLLSRFLSKYFIFPGGSDTDVDKVNSTNASTCNNPSKTQLAVWSGFLSLENLRLRSSLVNDHFQKKGLPFELSSGFIQTVEITVPWAQLRSLLAGGGGGAKNRNGAKESAAAAAPEAEIIVVLDGVYLLLNTRYEFYDDKLRESQKLQRKKDLDAAVSYVSDYESSASKSFSFYFKSYVKNCLLSETFLNDLFDNVANRIQIHVRNVHVRLEDLESDPSRPCCFGMTLESMHLTSEPEDDASASLGAHKNHNDVVEKPRGKKGEDRRMETILARKVIQIHQFTIYCNGMHGSDIHEPMHASARLSTNLNSCAPPEVLPLQSMSDQPRLLSHAMHAGIARRRPRSFSSRNVSNGPRHTYLLYPVNATSQVALSKPIKVHENGNNRAILRAEINVAKFQLGVDSSMLGHVVCFHARLKHHKSLIRHRFHRPTVPITSNPRLWWKYIVRVVRKELQEASKVTRGLRWSWVRWYDRMELRKRYMGLYERWLDYGVAGQGELMNSGDDDANSFLYASSHGDAENEKHLTVKELEEMRAIEDATIDDEVSVSDILIFRAMVHSKRQKQVPSAIKQSNERVLDSGYSLTRFLRRVIKSEDSDEEYTRMLNYLEMKEKDDAATRKQLELKNNGKCESDTSALAVVLSVETIISKGSLLLLSKRSASEPQVCVVDISLIFIQSKLSVLENFDSIIIESFVQDCVGLEHRSDGLCNIVFSRSLDCARGNESDKDLNSFVDADQLLLPVDLGGDDAIENSPAVFKHESPLLRLHLVHRPPGVEKYDASLSATLEKIHISLNSRSNWPHRCKEVFSLSACNRVEASFDGKAFWEELSIAYINDWKSSKKSLAAKVERTLQNQRKLDIDIAINSPLISISDGDGTTISIDLGHAHLATEQLAGVARFGEIHQMGSPNKSDSSVKSVRRHMRNLTKSDDTFNSQRKDYLFASNVQEHGLPSFLSPVFSGTSESPNDAYSWNETFSAISIESDQRRKHSRPVGNSKLFSVAEDEEYSTIVDSEAQAAQRELMKCFYDYFRLKVGGILVSITNSKMTTHVFEGPGIEAQIAKSTIPSDYSLCKFRVSCFVDHVQFNISKYCLSTLDTLFRNMKYVSANNTAADRMKYGGSHVFPAIGIQEPSISDDESSFDEDEFFDAISDYHPDDAKEWFNQQWVLDEESVGDIDTFARNTTRRRFPSTSEVSAGNMSKLDGTSESPTSRDDNDSFHSTISLDNQDELVNAIQEDIQRCKCKEDIELVKGKIRKKVDNENWRKGLENDFKHSRFRTRKLKCHLLRLEAELLALKSLYHEIVIELPACSQIEQERVVEDRDPHSIAQKEALHRASALIMARKICASHTSPPTTVSDHHCLSRLNRDLLFMSFTLSSITLNVLKDTTTFSGCEKAEHPLAFLLCDHLCFSIHHRQIDTRLKFCLDRISIASLGAGTACQCGYLDDTAFVRQSPVKIIEERCLCIAAELQRQSKQTSMQSPKVKIKLNFGPIELVPHAFVDAMSLLKTLKVDQNSKNQAPKPQNYTSDAVSKLARLVMGSSDVEAFEIQRSTDFDLQFKLVTFCLKNDDSLSLMTCTGINVRLARRVSPISLLKTRGQLDMSVSNFQVHQIAKNDEVCELIGCQNSFDQLISARIRVQLSRRESSGGWCIGNECDEFTGEFICLENRDARRSLCWNLHVGIKCQSTVVLIFSPDLCRMARNSEAVVDSVKGLMSGLKSSDSDNVTAFDPSATVLQKEIRREVHPKLAPAWDNDDRHDFSEVNTAIRWRVDHSMLEAIIILPGKHFRCSSGKLYDSACLRFSNSVRLCLQPDLLKSGNISIELLLRSYVVLSTPSKDELNLLEPITLSLSVYATPKLLKLTSSSMKLGAVDVPSTWAIGSPTMNTTPRDGFDMSIYVETSRLIFNVSPTLLVFVKEVNQIHKHKSHRNGSSQPSPSCTSSRMTRILSSQVTVPAVSVTLLDAPGSNVALPSYKSLFLSESISISVVSNAHRTFFSLSTGGAGIFYAKGSLIPVFYTTPIQSDCDDNAGEKFHLSTTLSKSDTSVELMLNIGASYFVVIPSFIEQSTRFCSKIISGHKKTIVPNQRERILTMTRLDWCPSSFNISCDEVNLVLPSQDVSSFCKGKDSLLNTIRLRWKPRVNATLIFKRAGAREVQPLHKIASFDTQSTDETNLACADSDRELDEERCNERCAYADSSLVALKVDCKADFSLTRTGLILQSFEVSDSKHHWLPVIFESVYEQLIITPFAFKFVASLVICNMLAPESDFENSMDSIFCSLGLHLDVGDVDILWHVAKSRFGFSDAFSLSVRPLLLREQSKLHAVSSKRSNLDSFTIQVTSPIQHTSSSSSIESTTGHIKIPEKIYFFLKDTQIISSVRIASIQVVCVPSNAKETTSPIVKAKLATLRVGASVLKCPYPGGATIPSDRISDSTNSYLYFSSWTDFNLSAHYHNRRLVIWEPLVETWAANMQGSVNLSDVFGMNPFNTEAREVTAGTTVSDRVRLIRFLEGIKQLRKSESKKEPDKKERVETYLFALTDGLNLCHFIQALVIPECLELANHPTAPQSFSHFTPVHRLETHYWNDHVSAMFSISNGKADQLRSKPNTVSVPLNINLTGALIENGIGFMLSEKSKSRSHISSHYIRNQTGSTLRWKDDSLCTCQESCGEIVPGGSEVLRLQGFPRRTYISLEMYNTSESLHFKAIRVNVDLVGTKRHVLKCPGNQKRANYVVVRVQLLDGAKVVSIESPVWIFNTSTLPFQLAMKENGKEIWHTLVLPRSSGDRSDIPRNAMPIPVHLVAKVISESVSWELSVTSDINVLQKQPPSVEVPFSFPKESQKRGLLEDVQLVLPTLAKSQSVAVSACSIRVGNNHADSKSMYIQPEQRLLVLRSLNEFRNNLPYPIVFELRISSHNETEENSWVNMGQVTSGAGIHFPSAQKDDKIEFRIKILDDYTFPDWSTSVVLTPNAHDSFYQRMTLANKNGVVLQVSVRLEIRLSTNHGAKGDSLLDQMTYYRDAASRVVFIYTPSILVDHTGESLEFMSGNATLRQQDFSMTFQSSGLGRRIGLSNVFDHNNLSAIVYMMGDTTTNLAIRQRGQQDTSPWSDRISIASGKTRERIFVPRPLSPISRPLVLCANICEAPKKLGGGFTRVVTLHNQYYLFNHLPIDIEVISTNRWGRWQKRTPLVVTRNEPPVPFHFDDSGFFRLRPNEIGWTYSGLISITRKRSDIALRLRNKLTGKALIVTIEYNKRPGPATSVVIRPSRAIPFRLENLTKIPIQFAQRTSMIRKWSDSTILLPYHKAEYAWDEPDNAKKCIDVAMADLDFGQHPSNDALLGCFYLDLLAPSTHVAIPNPHFKVTVAADGATRVLRIIDSSLSLSLENTTPSNAVSRCLNYECSICIDIGVSIVDWKPRELLYLYFGEIRMSRHISDKGDITRFIVRKISADCSLWITQYPVLLNVGQGKGEDAVSLSWCTDTNSRGKDITLVRYVQLELGKLFLKIDGSLIYFLMQMSKTASNSFYTKTDREQENALNDRDMSILWQPRYGVRTHDSVQLNHPRNILTAASAAKLPCQHGLPQRNTDHTSAFFRSAEIINAPKPKHKFYVESIKISAIRAEISWCGALPLPSWLNPAFMFEGLPIRFPSYTKSYIYGCAEEHLQSVKSHYNVWRFLFGLSLRPTFVARACIHTTRQSISTIFDSFLKQSRRALSHISSHQITFKSKDSRYVYSTNSNEAPSHVIISAASVFLGGAWRALLHLKLCCGTPRTLEHDVRVRAPRLFAKQDKSDVLVEYVEGENDGRALLSRVRMGRHLFEGYVFHGDVCGIGEGTMSPLDHRIFFILTLERLLILTSGRNVNVCSVFSEVELADVVLIDLKEKPHAKTVSLQIFFMDRGELGLEMLASKLLLFKDATTGIDLFNCILAIKHQLSQENAKLITVM